MKPFFPRAVVALALLLGPALARAAEIVDAAYVAEAQTRGALLWDVRDAKSFAEGHIPGALNVGEIGATLRNPNTEDWLPTEQVEAALGKAGLDILGKEVIVYARAGDANAYYGLNTVKFFGGRDARVFHGGLDEWRSAGKPVSTEVTSAPPVALKLAPTEGVVVWNEEMIAKVRADGTQIIDARTPGEFAGTDIRAIRGGHVPKAVNIPYEQNWVDPAAALKISRRETTSRAGMSLKPAADLRKLYAGLDPSKETIV